MRNARCPRFASVRWTLTWVEEGSDSVLFPSPPAAAARGFDANSFAAPQACAALAGHEIGGTVGAKYLSASRRSVFAARETVRPGLAPVSEQSHRSVGQHFHFSDDAVAAAMFAFPAAARAQRILHHSQRITVFQRFGGSVERIGHVGVYARDAVVGGTGARASGNGFVVRERNRRPRPSQRKARTGHPRRVTIIHAA